MIGDTTHDLELARNAGRERAWPSPTARTHADGLAGVRAARNGVLDRRAARMARRERLICASDALADGGPGVRFEVHRAGAAGAGVRRALPRHGARLRQRVPHQATELDWNPGEFFDAERLYLICATHGALLRARQRRVRRRAVRRRASGDGRGSRARRCDLLQRGVKHGGREAGNAASSSSLPPRVCASSGARGAGASSSSCSTFGFLFVALFAAIGALSRARGDLPRQVHGDGRAARRARRRRAGERGERDQRACRRRSRTRARRASCCASTAPAAARCRPERSTTRSGACARKYPDMPIYAVVEEICASGAYYVAVATDKIYVDKASLVGSIGVIMDGFGFVGAMDKLGVERRALDRRREQGLPRSVLADDAGAARLRAEDARRDPPAVHRRGQGGARRAPQGFARALLAGWSGTARAASSSASPTRSAASDYVAREVIKAEDVVDFTVKEKHSASASRGSSARRWGGVSFRRCSGAFAGTEVVIPAKAVNPVLS